MKNQVTLHTLFLALALLMACSRDPKPKEEKKVVDTVKNTDSLATTVFSKADENKVIGNINFGIDKKQFAQEENAFMATLEHNEHQTTYAIGGYLFSDLTGMFSSNKLNELNMTGDLIPPERYEAELLPQVEILKDLIAKKYGEAQEGSGAPAYKDLKKDQPYTAYSWMIGSKVINVDVVNRGEFSSCDLKITKK
jgi:hypothetical protein